MERRLMQIPMDKVCLIGMVHVQALPGTPGHSMKMRDIIALAVKEATILRNAGFDSVLLENMHDVPYLKRAVGPEITAAMTAAACAVKAAVNCPVGIQILAGANREALAAAQASGADYIRAEGFVFAHIADEGFMEADAGDLLRYRRMIGAEHVSILADIKKKHSSHAITADIGLADTAHAAEFFGADALVITGEATGRPVNPEHLQDARKGTHLPIIAGSGANRDNLPVLWPQVQGIIAGSWLKKEGRWDQPLDRNRVRQFLKAAAKLGHGI